MRHIILSVVLAASSGTIAVADESNAKSYLFVETADRAEMVDGQLILHGLDEEVTAFTDRPNRSGSVITREFFNSLWSQGDDSFKADPPNVALTGQVEGKSQVVILEILNPQSSGDQTTYDYKLIQGDKAVALENPVMVIDSWWRGPYTGPDGGLP